MAEKPLDQLDNRSHGRYVVREYNANHLDVLSTAHSRSPDVVLGIIKSN